MFVPTECWVELCLNEGGLIVRKQVFLLIDFTLLESSRSSLSPSSGQTPYWDCVFVLWPTFLLFLLFQSVTRELRPSPPTHQSFQNTALIFHSPTFIPLLSIVHLARLSAGLDKHWKHVSLVLRYGWVQRPCGLIREMTFALSNLGN